MDELIEQLEFNRRDLLEQAEAAKLISDYDTQWQLEARAEGLQMGIDEARRRLT
jgi:hypothetical protein